MYLFKKVTHLQAHLQPLRTKGKSIGFVPTMGALHEGHVSLIRASLAECDHTVCSIFVNPTQFNDPRDLEQYPRMPEKDVEMLTVAGCDTLFLPAVQEIYPPEGLPPLSLEFGALDRVMEGPSRPGHFQGVAQVVHRLLEITQPDKMYMGQKDYQQVAIVRSMIRQTGLPVEVVSCPTLRETGGLAMSSRNLRLSPEARKEASIIYHTLSFAKAESGHVLPDDIRQQAIEKLSAAGFKPEYFDIVDGHSLQPVHRWDAADLIVACTAVWVEGIRLIDNMVLKAPRHS